MKISNHMALPLVAALVGFAGSALAADNMAFSGTLRAHACSLHPDDGMIEMEFGEVGSRDLYLSGGTANQPFTIRLIDCNPAVASAVEVTFEGSRSTAISGALALDSGSAASGIAVVLSDAVQRQINLGTALTLPLTAATNTLLFHRRLQVEPDALANEDIVPGDFSANSTFALYYP